MNYLIKNGKVLVGSEEQGFGVIETDIFLHETYVKRLRRMVYLRFA